FQAALSPAPSITSHFHSTPAKKTCATLQSRDRSFRRIPIRYREGEVFEALLSSCQSAAIGALRMRVTSCGGRFRVRAGSFPELRWGRRTSDRCLWRFSGTESLRESKFPP